MFESSIVDKSSSEIKSFARDAIASNYGILFLINLFVVVVVNMIINMVGMNVLTTMTSGAIIVLLVRVILLILGQVFKVGELSVYLSQACDGTADFKGVFWGFSNHPDKNIVLAFLVNVIKGLACIPAAIITAVAAALVYFSIFADMSSRLDIEGVLMAIFLIVVLAFLFSVFCGIAVIIVECFLMPAFFLLLDFPEYTVSEILSKSVEIMKGNKWKYFCLMVSFWPLYLVGIFTGGIGLLFLRPYVTMSTTIFYLEMMEKVKRNDNLGSDEDY